MSSCTPQDHHGVLVCGAHGYVDYNHIWDTSVQCPRAKEVKMTTSRRTLFPPLPPVDPEAYKERLEDWPEARTEPSAATSSTHWALEKLLSIHAQEVRKRHRLRFTHREDDDTLTFVCICDAGFNDRSNWNDHITDTFSEL